MNQSTLLAEASRFLRYSSPGLLFAVESFLYFSLFHWDWTNSFLDGDFLKASLGFSALVFLGFIGVGFFFSLIHHVLFNFFCIYPSVKHRQMLNNAKVAGRLSFQAQEEKPDSGFNIGNEGDFRCQYARQNFHVTLMKFSIKMGRLMF